jgi:hypothetical protein
VQPAVSIWIATGFETVSFLAKKADEYFSEALTHPVLIKKSLNGAAELSAAPFSLSSRLR